MKKLLLCAVLSAVIFGFTGCYDAIYQSIRNEVELEEGTVSGFVNNVARYEVDGKQYLFTTNGLIYYKDASVSSHGAWNKLSGNGLPSSLSYSYYDSKFNGVHFYKVAADANYVYVLGYEMEYNDQKSRNQPSAIELFYAKPETVEGKLKFEWKRASDVSDKIRDYIKKLDKDNYMMDCSVHLFCTNSVNSAHREAFIRIGGGSAYEYNVVNEDWEVLKLNGDSFATVDPETNKELNKYTLSAVWFNGGVHYLNSLNAETNEGTAAALTEPTYLYFSDNGSCTNGTYLSSVKKDDFGAAEKVSVYKDQTKKSYTDADEVYELDAFTAYFAGLKSRVVSTDAEGKVHYSYEYTIPYKMDGDDKDSLLTRNNMSTTAPIISLAVTNDSVILGTGYNRSQGSSNGHGYGAFHLELSSDGKPAEKTSKFSTNADNVMCNPYYVRLLLCTDPSKGESEADIYSSLDYILTEGNSGTSIKNRGLWSYFPSRGNWNRE